MTQTVFVARSEEDGAGVMVDQPEDRARRLAEHEHRIHNHPCGCGSGKRYVDCCIDKINQEYIELRNRRQMARRSAEGKP